MSNRETDVEEGSETDDSSSGETANHCGYAGP
jgi:hypothetical protein